MGVERYVIEAVVGDGRSHREVARSAGVSKAWVTKLVARYRAGGEPAVAPRSRRPQSCAHAVSAEIQAAIVALRQQLDTAGYDHGPRFPAPCLGEHTYQVLTQVLELGDDEIARVMGSGACG